MPIIDTGSNPVTVGDLIHETRRHLYGTYQSEWNVLSEDLDATETGVDVADPLGGITRGAILAVDDEEMYVRSATGSTATVIRGFGGTIAATHANSSPVEVRPRYSIQAIRDALRDEVRSWPSGLFRLEQVTLAATANGESMLDLADIAEDYRQILDVKVQRSGSNRVARAKAFHHRGSTFGFTKGALRIDHPSPVRSGDTFVVDYARPFDPSSTASSVEVVNTWGVPESALDIPPLGAAWRLVLAREAIHVDPHARGTSQQAEAVRGGEALSVAGGFKQLRDQRLSQEQVKLRDLVAVVFG